MPGADPERWFGASQLAQASALHRSLAQVRTCRALADAAVLVLFLALGLAEHLVRPYPQALWTDRVLVVFVALEAAALPHRLLAGAREQWLLADGVAEGAERTGEPGLGRLVVGPIASAVVRLVLGGLLLLCISAVARATPWWPVVVSVVLAVVSMAAAVLYPFVVAPVVDRVVRVNDPEVLARIGELARRAGLGCPTVLAAVGGPIGDEGAYVAGFGRARRLVIAADVVRGPTADLDVVVAHELGHWKLGHHRRATTAWLAAAAAALAFLALADLLVRTLAAGGDFDRLDPRLLPLWMVLAVGAGAVSHLVLCAVSRSHERDADAFAVGLLGDGRHLAAHLRRVMVQAGSDLAPSRWRALSRDHPPPAERLADLLAPPKEPRDA
ncbi:MAG: M48 family metalloprotease [Acidimicrobiia bacterium]|nr:M48 family metalloprotease [Acidimicrobiia bacterium]